MNNEPTAEAADEPAGSRPEQGLARWLTWLETALLGLILFAIVGLSGTQVVLRNFFDSGIVWAEPASRALVLWLALVGGFAAARRDKHIRIDLLGQHAPARLKSVLTFMTGAATAVVCGLIAWHGGRLVLLEMEYSTPAFASVPTWVVQLIIPAGFGLIAIVYLIHAARAIARFWSGR